MTVNNFLKISDTINNPYIEKIKSENKNVLGYYCTYVPEEIIEAGNILGVRMRGIEAKSSAKADVIFSSFNCSFIKANLELVLDGKYNFLDGLVCLNSCDHARRMYDIFKRAVIGKIDGFNQDFPLFFLSVPHLITDRGFNWLKDEYSKFKSDLESTYHIAITDEKLRESIVVYNENRSLLKELHKMRASDKPKLRGSDFIRVINANYSVPKMTANKELKSLIGNLKDKDGISNHRARLLITGSVVEKPDLLEIIESEDVGGQVVSDLMCFGTRNFWDLTEENGDPMTAITKRYYNKISCPRMMNDHDRRLKFLKERIKEDKIDGIIANTIEFCDLSGCENMLYEHEFKELDIPILTIDIDYFMGDIQRYKTRIEAFLEQIE
jgi:benzoyl-CoA reductase/2-hydroxyglutaryl-CoA dehydratase subunit BcrC/BadD/HgdB